MSAKLARFALVLHVLSPPYFPGSTYINYTEDQQRRPAPIGLPLLPFTKLGCCVTSAGLAVVLYVLSPLLQRLAFVRRDSLARPIEETHSSGGIQKSLART